MPSHWRMGKLMGTSYCHIPSLKQKLLKTNRSNTVSIISFSLSFFACLHVYLCIRFPQMCLFSCFQFLSLTSLTYLSFLLGLICSERRDTKPLARANQVRPRDVQAKKQQSATLPASSKPAGGTAATTRHRDGASGTKKTNKATGKTGSSTQAKANPRNTNNTSRGIGKFS